MATWPLPVKTWVHGETPPASTWNAELRDRFEYLFANQGASAGHFRGVRLRTHVNPSNAPSQVQLLGANLIIMNDGVAVTDWPVLTASIASGGANGLDTGAEAASTWYEIYVIRKSSDGTRALLLHKCHAWSTDEQQLSTNSSANIRDNAARTKVAQGFQIDETGGVPVSTVRVVLVPQGSPTGYIWMTIEGDSAGNPDGVAIAESQRVDVATLSAGGQDVVFQFRGAGDLAALTQYHMVLQGDYAISAVNYVQVYQQNTDVYARGQRKDYSGAAWSGATADLMFYLTVTTDATALTMPAGYDQHCLIGYVRNDGSSNFLPFIATDRFVEPLGGQLIVSGYTLTAPTVLQTPTILPPVACKAWFSASLTAATGTRSIAFGGAEDGYRSAYTPRLGGQAVMTSAAIARGEVGPILTESHWVYVKINGDSWDLYVGPWEWIA